MKKFVNQCIFAISLLTSITTVCSDDEKNYANRLNKSYKKHNATQAMNAARENNNFKNADKKSLKLQPQKSTPKPTPKKIVVGSAAYAASKNK